MKTPVVLSWSGGKDSALALESLRESEEFEVVALLTTLTREFDRIAMHGVRHELLDRQAESIGLPIAKAWISSGAGNDEYEQSMSDELLVFHERGVDVVAFGDLFLQDIREYRERLVGQLGMTPIFPIWGRDTTELATHFVDRGFRALTCCVDTAALPASFCGRELTADFFRDLPPDVDPCGENGEFHTFVFDGPIMSTPLEVCCGDSRQHDRFAFRDIQLTDNG